MALPFGTSPETSPFVSVLHFGPSTGQFLARDAGHRATKTLEESWENSFAISGVIFEIFTEPAMGIKRSRHQIASGHREDKNSAKVPGHDGETREG